MAPFDSHGRAPFSLAGRRRGCQVFFLGRTSRTKVLDNFGLDARKLPNRWNPALFSVRKFGATPRWGEHRACRRTAQSEPPSSGSAKPFTPHALNATLY